jgi:hypothetical protein
MINRAPSRASSDSILCGSSTIPLNNTGTYAVALTAPTPYLQQSLDCGRTVTRVRLALHRTWTTRTPSARTVGSSQSGSRVLAAASSRCSSRSSTKRGDACGRIQGEIHHYIGDASVRHFGARPGVQLDPPAWRRPVLLGPLIEAGVVGQRDLPSAGAQDDPRPLGLVLGHAVAILSMRTHVRIAVKSRATRANRLGPRSPRSWRNPASGNGGALGPAELPSMQVLLQMAPNFAHNSGR